MAMDHIRNRGHLWAVSAYEMTQMFDEQTRNRSEPATGPVLEGCATAAGCGGSSTPRHDGRV